MPTGSIPTSVVAGDFNEDGKTDIAIANGGGDSIYVFPGNGDGTFGVPVVLYTSGQAPISVAAVKLHSSGHLDLVVVDGDSRTVEEFAGNGNGSFQPPATVATFAQTPTFVVPLDANRDGYMDIAIGLTIDPLSTEPQFSILLGDGSGAFPRSITAAPLLNGGDSPAPTDWISIGDMNRDGFPDIVTTVSFGGAISYLNQNGAAFLPAESFGPAGGALAVALADMDGDGCLDAIETSGYGLLTIAKGTCDGKFTQTSPAAALGDLDVALQIADVDGDGIPDVVASSAYSEAEYTAGIGNFGGYFVSVLRGDGKGGVHPASIYRVGPEAYSLVVADIKGNNRPDIVTVSETEATSSILSNDGNGGFGPSGEAIGYLSGITNAPIPSADPQTVDVNGDEKPDVLVLEFGTDSSQSPQIAALLNDGTGNLLPPVRSAIPVGSSLPYPLFAVGKFRKTNFPDLIYVTRYAASNIVASFPGNGDGTFGAPSAIGTLPDPRVITVGDFNGDQRLDFAVVGTTGSGAAAATEVDIFEGNGDGTFTHLPRLSFSPQTSAPPVQLITGDFDHDGKLDLLIGYNENSGWVSSGDDLDLVLGNGDGTFRPATTLFSHFGPVLVSDINHDGYLDLIQARDPSQDVRSGALAGAGAYIVPAMTVYLGGPGATFLKGTTYLAPGVVVPSTRPVIAGDFNGDGNLDLAIPYLPATIGLPWEYRLQIFQGIGDGTFIPVNTPYQLPAYDIPVSGGDFRSLGVTDLLDLVGATSTISTIPSAPTAPLSFTVDSTPLNGTSGSATITLSLPATSVEDVSLSASDSSVQFPTSVSFNPGEVQKSVAFSLGSGFDRSHLLFLYADLNGQRATANVRLPNPHSSSGVIATIGPQIPGVTAIGLTPGQSLPELLTLQSLGGYSGTFNQFSCLGLPAGVTCNFAQSVLQIQPGRFSQVAFDLVASSSAVAGTFSASIQASNLETSSAASIILGVGDFSLDLSQGSVVLNGNVAPTISVTATYLNGVTDSVTLSCTGLPAGTSCVVPGPVYPANPTTQISVVQTSTSSVAPGTYHFQIVGTSTHASHTVNATLQVEGLTASLDRTAASIATGGTATFTVTFTSQNHFSSSSIAVRCQGVTGISCSTPSASVGLNEGGTATTQLSVTYLSASAKSVLLRDRMQIDFCALAGVILAFFSGRRYRTQIRKWLIILTAAGGIVLISSCGGSGSSGGAPGAQTVSVGVIVQANTYAGQLQQTAGTITLTVH